MTSRDQREELEALKARVHALESSMVVVIDILKKEIDKSDAYGLFKRMNKMLSVDGMQKSLDDAKDLISSGK